jgi:hypothetical protein
MGNRESMITKLGSEEAYRSWMSENAKKSSKNRKGKWGFAHMKENNPDRLKELAKKGGESGRAKV